MMLSQPETHMHKRHMWAAVKSLSITTHTHTHTHSGRLTDTNLKHKPHCTHTLSLTLSLSSVLMWRICAAVCKNNHNALQQQRAGAVWRHLNISGGGSFPRSLKFAWPWDRHALSGRASILQQVKPEESDSVIWAWQLPPAPPKKTPCRSSPLFFMVESESPRVRTAPAPASVPCSIIPASLDVSECFHYQLISPSVSFMRLRVKKNVPHKMFSRPKPPYVWSSYFQRWSSLSPSD